MAHSPGISSHIITNSEGHAALKCAQCPNLYRWNLADEAWHPTKTNLQDTLLRSFGTSLWTYDKIAGPLCAICSGPSRPPTSSAIESHITTTNAGRAVLRCAQCPNLWGQIDDDDGLYYSRRYLELSLLKDYSHSHWTYTESDGPLCPACSQSPHD